ncbi:hypothetical protein A2U01_0070961, partial [Trifolium medium]|nr:hypothetical protein [Trifolium medium]
VEYPTLDEIWPEYPHLTGQFSRLELDQTQILRWYYNLSNIYWVTRYQPLGSRSRCPFLSTGRYVQCPTLDEIWPEVSSIHILLTSFLELS